jgi:hypothetical protein
MEKIEFENVEIAGLADDELADVVGGHALVANPARCTA